MGHGFELKCKECDYSEHFYLGDGMMYFPLRKVINEENIKNKKLREEILGIIDNHKVIESDYGHEIYKCDKCDKLYRKFFLELKYDEDKFFRTEYSCVKCRDPLTKIHDNQLDEMACPECHKKGLYKDGFMRWD